MQLIAASIIAFTGLVAAQAGLSEPCVSGSYACFNSGRGANSTINICSNGQWFVGATCAESQSCVVDAAGGLTCQFGLVRKIKKL